MSLEETENISGLEATAGEDGNNTAGNSSGGNRLLRKIMNYNFIEYSIYVIRERAIPNVDDGLKPVQRRILWSLFRMDDGRFNKVANVIGHTMQFHPHGDQSIAEALVVLANKEYFIEKQGNFGNVFTGDGAAAPRYIECRLSRLGREVLYDNDITEFIDSYDGRNKEPVTLPVKIPSLLLLGTRGVAVVMSTMILPHNFRELLEAQIACLRKSGFALFPDFLQGGMMDASEYDDGNGKIFLRAKIKRDGRNLIIYEIPATTTTESIIASIEKAVGNDKIKIAGINDFTAENVGIEIVPMRGQDPNQILQALYAYTECAVSIKVNMVVVCDDRPVRMTVSQVIRRNTGKLLDYLKRELEIKLDKLQEQLHGKLLIQIFIGNRIYKRIEECETVNEIINEIKDGFEPFRHTLDREVSNNDIQSLLAIPIMRISRFDMARNKQDIGNIAIQIDEAEKHLRQLENYAIQYIESLLQRYGEMFPRRTEICLFDRIDRGTAALDNIKVGWDSKKCYVGTDVNGNETVVCNEFDRLLCVERNGRYKVIAIPKKIYVGRLIVFRKYDAATEFGVVYKDLKSGKSYGKRCRIDKFITDHQYRLCPPGCRLQLFTTQTCASYQCEIAHRIKEKQRFQLNLRELPGRNPQARGMLISLKPLLKLKYLRDYDTGNINEPDL